MVITVVMDQYGNHANGTTAAARHFVQQMRNRGHAVRVVTCVDDKEDPNIHLVKEVQFPGFMKLIYSHGMVFGKPDKKVLREAFNGADIVHIFLPFFLARASKKIADDMGIASFISFHLPPEHITQNIRLGRARFITNCIHLHWRKMYNRFTHIHTPSEALKKILIRKGYKSNIHVVSNGIHPDFTPKEIEKPLELKDKFVIVMSGRLAREKLQNVLIQAVANSKYNNKIQVILCGGGMREKALQKLGDKILANKPIIKFCTREELVNILNYADLYVHTSEVEAEAIACMEAFACGKVPIISDSELSATSQFARYPQNKFKNKNITDLTAKIEWFIENPDRLKEMSEEYAEYAKNFSLSICADRLEDILLRVIAEHKEKQNAIC